MSEQRDGALTEVAKRSQDYRALWETDAKREWTKVVIDQAGAWLGPKLDHDVDLNINGVFRSRRGHRLEVRHHVSDDERALRVTMDEVNQGGHYTTSLMAVEKDRGKARAAPLRTAARWSSSGAAHSAPRRPRPGKAAS